MPISESFGLTSEIPTAGCCEVCPKPPELLTAFKLLVKINYLPKRVRCCNKLLHVVMSLYEICSCICRIILDACMLSSTQNHEKDFSKVYKFLLGWTLQLPKYELPLPRETEVESFEKGHRFQQLQRFQCPLITYIADEEKTVFY